MDSKKGFLQGLIVGAVISGGLYIASILVACYECTCNFFTCGDHITEDSTWHFVGFIQSWNFLWIALAICLVCGLIGALYGWEQDKQYCERNGIKTKSQEKKEIKEENRKKTLEIRADMFNRIIMEPYEESKKKLQKDASIINLNAEIENVENSILINKIEFDRALSGLTKISQAMRDREKEFYELIVKKLDEKSRTALIKVKEGSGYRFR